MTGSPPVGVGLIGFGYAGRTFHAPLITSLSELALASICTTRPREAEAACPGARIVTSPDALLADPAVELVVIATPNARHAPLALQAIAAGKAVLVEKPFALDRAEAAAVLAAGAAAGVPVAAFQNRRFDSDFLTVRAALADGAIGPVPHFESHFDRFRPQVRDRWREHDVPGAGVWYDLAPHLIDQTLQLFGSPRTVTALMAGMRPGAQTDDWFHAVLAYDGLRVVLHASMLVAGGVPRFIAHGDGGSLVKAGADRQEAQLLSGQPPGEGDWGRDPDPLRLWDADGERPPRPALSGDQRQIYRQMAAAVRGDAPSPTSSAEILAVMAVLDAGRRSAREGVTVPLDPPA